SAVRAAFGSKVDQKVGALNDVQVVLDDDYSVAEANQPLQHVEQLAHISEMEPSGWFVKNVNSSSRGAFGKFFRQLDALSFAARKCRCRLAQFDVTQTDVEQRLKFLLDLRNVLQQRQSFFDCRVEQFSNRL